MNIVTSFSLYRGKDLDLVWSMHQHSYLVECQHLNSFKSGGTNVCTTMICTADAWWYIFIPPFWKLVDKN